MKRILALALLALFLAAPLSLAGQLSLQGESSFGATSSLQAQFNIVLDEPSNATGTIVFQYDNQTGNLNLQVNIQGKANLTGVQLQASGQGSAYFVNGELETHDTGRIILRIMNVTSGGGMGGGQGFPGTQQYPPTSPPSSPTNFTMDIAYTLTRSGTITNASSNTTGNFDVDIYVENGALLLLGLEGDIVANITGHYKSYANTTYQYYDAVIILNFNSGNNAVDEYLASAIHTALTSGFIGGGMGGGVEGNLVINSDMINTTALNITIHYEGSVQGFQAPMQPPVPGMGPGFNFTQPVNYNTTVIPANANVTVDLDYSYNIQAGGDSYSITAQATGLLKAEGLGLPLSLANADVNIEIANTTVSGTITSEAAGDPEAAYATVKALLKGIADEVSSDDQVYFTLHATGGYKFVLLQNGRQELGDTVVLTQNNLTLIKHIFLEAPGTRIVSVSPHMIVVSTVSGEAKAKLGLDDFDAAKVIVVNAKGAVVSLGNVVVEDNKTIVVNASDAKAKVEIVAGTAVAGNLSVTALSQQEAQDHAASYGYMAAGDAVAVEGIESGKAVIAVQADAQAAQQGRLAILEISTDGTTKLITNVEVNGSMVVFVATNFSTFVPVYTEAGGGTGGETTTTTTTPVVGTSPATTTTSTTGGVATTTTGGKATTTTGQTGTQTTQTGGETTTGTAGGAGTTSEAGGGSETTTTGGGGGVSTTAIAAVVIIILVAVAFLVLRR